MDEEGRSEGGREGRERGREERERYMVLKVILTKNLLVVIHFSLSLLLSSFFFVVLKLEVTTSYKQFVRRWPDRSFVIIIDRVNE